MADLDRVQTPDELRRVVVLNLLASGLDSGRQLVGYRLAGDDASPQVTDSGASKNRTCDLILIRAPDEDP
jgi:hypothetical protein